MNRREIVTRHNPKVNEMDFYSPFTVGNGEFAFTADVTGLQTFLKEYERYFPLCTQAQWGWHTQPTPNEKGKISADDLSFKSYDVNGKKVKYLAYTEKDESYEYNWLRENPHRMHMGKIGFGYNDTTLATDDIASINQQLNLWSGILESEFEIDYDAVSTQSFCHPTQDAVCFKIQSDLLASKKLYVELDFPYGSQDMCAANWANDDLHNTEILEISKQGAVLKRTMDDASYYVNIRLESSASIIREGNNSFKIIAHDRQLVFTVNYSKEQNAEDAINYDIAKEVCIKSMESFWMSGGMIDFKRCLDDRANELERRVILSQYLMKVQCSGTLPPQETGLSFNSWYGKYHLEMHWWHGVHFPLWSRKELFEKSLWWYKSILARAKDTAKIQGYEGARWPKMTDPSGDESPSPIGPFLIWQQPHPIYYAELIYSQTKSKETLESYKRIVFETAEFMASYAHYDKDCDRYNLGPMLIPAQENHAPEDTLNPTFELEYWAFGLNVANKWRERLGFEKDAKWEEVANNLAQLPQKDGFYMAHENCLDTFKNYNTDHPSMLGAMGILPGIKVNKEVMMDTLIEVLDKWDIIGMWGWDFPMMAMTAARLSQPEIAIDMLLYSAPKNTYLPNGHNKQSDREDLPIYLPGNGGLLTAIAMMAAGWEGCTKENPGFPKNGKWNIEWEDLKPML